MTLTVPTVGPRARLVCVLVRGMRFPVRHACFCEADDACLQDERMQARAGAEGWMQDYPCFQAAERRSICCSIMHMHNSQEMRSEVRR